jgi:hypothetical protein
MRSIRVFALGTYYKTKAPTPGENAWPMRWLTYWAKKDEKRACRREVLCHPLYPKKHALFEITSHEEAYDYIADIISFNFASIREALQLPDRPLHFSAVPSSSVTAATLATARCSGREIGTRLAQRGLGTSGINVVPSQAIKQKTDGGDYSFEDLVRLYKVVKPLPLGRIPVYLDDMLTWGNHMAAVDAALGRPRHAAGIVVTTADSRPQDAYNPRLREINVYREFTGTQTTVSVKDVEDDDPGYDDGAYEHDD